MTRLAAFGLAAAIALGAGGAAADEAKPARCAAPPALTAIGPTLGHAASRIEHGAPVTIVAVGSSSTQGVGASAPALSYPSRLEGELRNRVPGVDIRVVNRGKGGEDAAEELARLKRDVIAENPDLVIWQVGTNGVLRRDDIEIDEVLLRRGVAQLQQSGTDVVLMDMQYAPRVVERPAYAAMQQLIAEIAHHTHVGLFRRFALMQYWQAKHRPDAPPMIGADGLHMTDAGYGCLATELAEALAANWSHSDLAERADGVSGKVAGLGRSTRPTAPEIDTH
ncbi:MAG TPA: SGNH/GDSL hydrolase family protein [Stellaceae bacterium]|nr:SGNH/GDSL hydrolase family protein [Stellaceae bacterium]